MTTRCLVCATALLAALTIGAGAADIPAPAPVYKAPAAVFVPSLAWAGWYGGVGGGYAFGDPSVNVTPGTAPLPPSGQALSTFIPGQPFTLHTRPSGGFGGLLIGYNWQFQNYVVGWETDFSFADIKDTAVGGFVNQVKWDTDTGSTLGTVSLKSKLDWFGTLRARWGWMIGSALPYVTGGLAYGHVKSDVLSSATQVLTTLGGTSLSSYAVGASFSDTLIGYSAGAGIDWVFATRWIVRAEYLYINLPGGDHTVTGVPAVSSVSTGMDAHLARAAVIYRWGPP